MTLTASLPSVFANVEYEDAAPEVRAIYDALFPILSGN